MASQDCKPNEPENNFDFDARMHERGYKSLMQGFI